MEMYKPNQERLRNFWITLQDTWLTLYGSSVPTAAAINVNDKLSSYNNNNNVNILILRLGPLTSWWLSIGCQL